MSSLKLYVLAISLLALAWGPASPAVHAQTGTIPRTFQLNPSGSFLGIQMEDVTSGNMPKYKLSSERGVIVKAVMKGSPAEAANLHQDDVILDFAGFPVWSSTQLSRMVEETPPGRKVDLAISRDGKKVTLTVQIGDRNSRRWDYQAPSMPGDIWGPNGRSFQFRTPDLPDPSQTRRPRLGVTLQPLTDQLAEYFGVPNKKGALVSSVSSGSPASGKLNPGDVIVAADGKEIGSPDELSSFIRDKGNGNVTLKVIRDKREMTVVIELPAPDGAGSYKL